MLPTSDLESVCSACVAAGGLCGKEACRNSVLPQLAQNRGWLKLIGDAVVEQKDRQSPEPSERKQLARIARRNARKVARSQRGGYFGLAKAIMRHG